MRRLVVLFSAATLSLAGGVIATSAVASGGTDTTEPSSSTAAHPIIGTWMVTDTRDPESDPGPIAFTADGIVINVETEAVGLGVWEPTGPTGVSLTFVEPVTGEGPDNTGTVTIRATGEVAADGQTFTADYTIEVNGVVGFLLGEYGPGTVTGTRVVVEPMGTPVGSLEELFGGPEEGTEGTGVTEGTAMAEATEVAAPPTTSS
jgi:hypothetical protein